MKKTNLVRRMAIATMAAIMTATTFAPAIPVSANDGTGIESQKDCSVKEYDATATVTSSSANVREGAGTEFRILNTFKKGQTFQIDGVVLRNGEKTDWYRVTVTDKQFGGECSGYINKSTFRFADEQDELSEDFRDLLDNIYAAQPGTAGGSEKTAQAAMEFKSYVEDHGEELSVDEIRYATELYLNENTQDFAKNFKESFDAVCQECMDEDESLEFDVNYNKFVNGINDALENVITKNDDTDADHTEAKCNFKVEKVNKTMKTIHDVYVRKGPKTTYDKMGSFEKGVDVKVTGQVYKHGNKACWVQVDYKGNTGYVCTDYLK